MSELTTSATTPVSDAPRTSLPARLLLAIIAAWRWTAPVRRPSCRFHPTCSAYAAEAISRFGARRGGWSALKRLARCHPWNPGGVDPVKEDPCSRRSH